MKRASRAIEAVMVLVFAYLLIRHTAASLAEISVRGWVRSDWYFVVAITMLLTLGIFSWRHYKG